MKILTKVIAITMLMACASGAYYLSGFGGGFFDYAKEISKQLEDKAKAKLAADQAAAAAICDCLVTGQCEGKDLTGCNLEYNSSYKSFAGGHFKNANLSGKTLSWVDFSNADLTGVNLSNAVTRPYVRFTGAILKNANLTGIKINQVSGFGIQVADFSYADLTGATVDQNTLKALPRGAVKGMIWPDGTCPDHRCSTNPNKKTVILSTINNQSNFDYRIATTNAPLNELLNEINKSPDNTSQLTNWLSFYKSNNPETSYTFNNTTGKRYSFRFLGEYNDKSVIANARTTSNYPPAAGNINTYPDVSSNIDTTGTDAQTIILFPVDFENQCSYVHLIGRSEGTGIFAVFTYATYRLIKGCGNTKDAPAVKAPQTSSVLLDLNQAGTLSVVINNKGIPTSITATKA